MVTSAVVPRARAFLDRFWRLARFRPDSAFPPELALLHDEVQILIFGDPAELEKRQRPVLEYSGG